MARPLIPLLIALMTGISCGTFFDFPDGYVQFCLSIAVVLALFTVKGKWRRFFYPPLLISFFLLGILEMNLCLQRHPGKDHIRHFIGEEKSIVEGMICDNPQVSPDKTELIACASRIVLADRYQPVSGRVLLNVRPPYPYRYGDVVRFKARIRAPRNFHNPGAFDYETHLRFRGILVRGSISDPTGIIVLRRDRGNFVRSHLERFRDRIRDKILEKAPGTDGLIIQAMVLGDQKEIPKDVMEKFNRTGTTHLIAISGFNVGIVIAFSMFLIHFLLKSSEYLLLKLDARRVATFFSIITVVLYTFIAGMGVSVVRASIMGVLFMLTIIFNRARDLYNTLAFSAFIILVVAPYSLFDISFQLSFAAVAALIFLTPRMAALLPALEPPTPQAGKREQFVHFTQKAGRGVLVFFFVSLSATLGTLPLILHYFNRLSLVTLLANLIVVPILGVIATPVFLLLILTIPLSDFLTDGVMAVSSFLVRVSLDLVDKLASLSWSSIYVSTPNVIEIGAFYLLLISAGFCLDRCGPSVETSPTKTPCGPSAENAPAKTPRRLWIATTGLMVLFFVLDAAYLHLRNAGDGKMTLTAVDVGQGNAALMLFA